METNFKLIAKTFFGLEDVLVKELENLGAKDIEKISRAVAFSGDMTMLYKANYLLRTAISILKPIYTFEANNEKELYDKVFLFSWEKFINPDGNFCIEYVVNSSIFTHSLYASQKTKDAICDRMRKKFAIRPSINKVDPDIILNLHIYENQVTVSLNSSGDSLFKRNYRKKTGVAPINEVVAAGLIQLSGWNRDTNFFDPMCGSGTLLIEAAMYANNIPAQYYRKDFAFKKWGEFSPIIWKGVVEKANKEIREFDYEIWGSDVSSQAIRIAEENITNAKLQFDIKLFRNDIITQEPPKGKTLIITNPPYGERMEEDDIFYLYEQIGSAFKNKYSNNEAWIISSDFEALKHVGLRPSRKITIFNSNLECKFCKYELYEGSKKAKKQNFNN
ncbi:MAG: class I SAM-dependent RNA methyltransferase [Bacteroidales bacterium]|jgi:putative N6-adenine-specific DNA methylase|nr:class I SAM-dependent RNA methyltransferase [Bacteroidales bacterium]